MCIAGPRPIFLSFHLGALSFSSLKNIRIGLMLRTWLIQPNSPPVRSPPTIPPIIGGGVLRIAAQLAPRASSSFPTSRQIAERSTKTKYHAYRKRTFPELPVRYDELLAGRARQATFRVGFRYELEPGFGFCVPLFAPD